MLWDTSGESSPKPGLSRAWAGEPSHGLNTGSGQRWLGGSHFACPNREKTGGIGKRAATGINKRQDGGKEYLKPSKY